MRSSLAKAFIIFEVIFSIVLTNMLFVVGSIASVFLLFPVLLISTLYYIRRMYLYHEYTGLIYNYTKYIKGNVGKSIKLLYPLVLFIALLLLSIFYYNQIIFEAFDPFLVWFIYIIQSFMLYQSIGVMIIASILYGKNNEITNKEILNRAFIIFNAHPIRAMMSMTSLIVGAAFIIRVIPFSYLLIFPIILFLFYVVFSDVLELKKYD